MLKIALVDDNQKHLDDLSAKIYRIADKWNESFDVYHFNSGEELCEALRKNTFTVIFLDVELKGMDGIETLSRIKKLSSESYIIFISSYDGRIRELFAEKVIGFILKPADFETLEMKLKIIYEILDSRDVFIYKKNSKLHTVYSSEIIYFESNKHYVTMYTKKGQVEFKGKLSDIWDIIKIQKRFAFTHRSFIVNLEHTNFASRNTIEISSKTRNKIIPISKKYRYELDTRLMTFMSKIGMSDVYY